MEIRKTRPVVVVSNDHLNELSQLAVVVPRAWAPCLGISWHRLIGL